jgi:hypothetical protein
LRLSTQVSLLPPPCEEFTTSEPFPQGNARETAGHDMNILAKENVGPKIHVTSFHVIFDKRWERAKEPAVGCAM